MHTGVKQMHLSVAQVLRLLWHLCGLGLMKSYKTKISALSFRPPSLFFHDRTHPAQLSHKSSAVLLDGQTAFFDPIDRPTDGFLTGTIEIAIRVRTAWPTATETPIIVISVVTREGPAAGTTGPALTTAIVTNTIDAQPPSCSSRWVFYISSASTIITSGDYAGTAPRKPSPQATGRHVI